MALVTPPQTLGFAPRRGLAVAVNIKMNAGDNDGGLEKKKFTGQSLFEVDSSSPPNKRSPYDREANLASNFQRTLPLQAALLLFSIAFAVYVGVTGGITDGSDRNFDDEIDDVPWLNDGNQPTTVIYDDSPSSSKSVFI